MSRLVRATAAIGLVGAMTMALSLTPGSAAASSMTSSASLVSQKAMVKDWLRAAQIGKAVNVPVRDQENLAVAQKLWGSGGNGVGAGAGVYFSYSVQGVALGVNKGDQIFDVRSFSSAARKITRSAVVAALGAPGSVLYASGTTIYLYPAGANYQLLWVFNGGPGHTSNRVNHVDVFWPRGTVDLMAQNVPNPSIAMMVRPGRYGAFFTFGIQDAPVGYRLSEIEWIPARGQALAETYRQAVANARIPELRSGFQMGRSHVQFRYPPSARGETGMVQLVYQNANGGAIIGTSRAINLK